MLSVLREFAVPWGFCCGATMLVGKQLDPQAVHRPVNESIMKAQIKELRVFEPLGSAKVISDLKHTLASIHGDNLTSSCQNGNPDELVRLHCRLRKDENHLREELSTQHYQEICSHILVPAYARLQAAMDLCATIQTA